MRTKINRFTSAILCGSMLVVGFSSCLERKGDLKHEAGYIVEKQYFPDTRQLVTGTGFSSNGSTVITTHEIGEDEKYMVIFKCEHGVVFSMNNSDLYYKLDKGDSVTIDYYEMANSNGEVLDFDFIDANKQTNNTK